jgi:hypothetical protein
LLFAATVSSLLFAATVSSLLFAATVSTVMYYFSFLKKNYILFLKKYYFSEDIL